MNDLDMGCCFPRAERCFGSYTTDSAPAREQKESGERMEHLLAIPRMMLKAFMDECLTAGQTREQLVKLGRWMIRISP